MGTFTTNLNLYEPSVGETGWGAAVNTNFTTLDNALVNPAPTVTGTLTPAGLVDISGVGAGQIKFPATQNPSANANTLDDYEEGTWTPVVGGSATYTTQSGVYTKIGRLVHVICNFQINAIGTGSTTIISGLPFSVGTNGATAPVLYLSAATALIHVIALFNIGTSTVTLYSNTAATGTLSSGTTVLGNSTFINFSASYTV